MSVLFLTLHLLNETIILQNCYTLHFAFYFYLLFSPGDMCYNYVNLLVEEEIDMNHSPKISLFPIAEREYDFICKQADEKNMTIEEYIVMCVLAYNNSLYLCALANQLRRLKYQLKSMPIEGTGDSRQQLIEMQENLYNDIANALQALCNG